MAERLPLPASRVAEVVAASGASKATVLRYRQTRGDGSPAHGHLPLYEAAITKAIRELPEPAQMEIQQIQPAGPNDLSSTPDVVGVMSGVEYASFPGWGERSRETGMARSDARESQTARTPSPYCKDPVSAPARAAAGGDVLGAASIPAPPAYRPKRCRVTLLVVGPDGSESEVRA
jgi:hypothetical protein